MISTTEFWDWFKNNSSQFFFLNQIDDENEKQRILDEFDSKLNEYSEGLYFEIGGHPDDTQDLIITADGDINYFKDVKHLVENAPKISNWNIIAFKPPINEKFEINYEDIFIDSDNIWFKLDKNEDDSLNITLFFKNLEKRYESQYGSVSLIILQTILGERYFNEKVSSVFFDELHEEELKELYQLASLSDKVKNVY
tara:strand:+ start:2238 stop:2828 length:591 start_codon:yes stop_codon:yes gene_type:complete